MTSIANSTSFGGIVKLKDELVSLNDGMFEVLLIKMPKTIVELDTIIRSIINQDYSCPLVDFFQASRLSIDNEPGLEWSLDGECIVPDDHFEFSVIPKFLELQG